MPKGEKDSSFQSLRLPNKIIFQWFDHHSKTPLFALESLKKHAILKRHGN